MIASVVVFLVLVGIVYMVIKYINDRDLREHELYRRRVENRVEPTISDPEDPPEWVQKASGKETEES